MDGPGVQRRPHLPGGVVCAAEPAECGVWWTPQLREKNLPVVVDNPMFLILPPSTAWPNGYCARESPGEEDEMI